MKEIGVAIIEDDRGTREGLAMLIGGASGYRCTGGYSSVEQALVSITEDIPDVVLLDINLPGMLGSTGAALPYSTDFSGRRVARAPPSDCS